jgi:hypothetical protein
MCTKYYYLFLLIPLFTNCFSYVHVIERTIASFEDSPAYSGKIKSCQNCKYYIENQQKEFSRCSKFAKYSSRQLNKRKPNYFQYIKVNSTHGTNSSNNDFNTVINFYLATTCRNNEKMCGLSAKHYERKFHDIY